MMPKRIEVKIDRNHRASQKTNTELAREFGVTRAAIRFIRQRINWRHI
jgi:hypothetical protein